MKLSIVFFISLPIILISGCGSNLGRKPVPINKMSDAVTIDEPVVRAPVGMLTSEFQQDIIDSVKTFNQIHVPTEPGCEIQDDLLALSGGGADGAFGAGFINGWTQSGTRPVFKFVSGVSSGALIAPFAFLGPEYDHVLKKIYTGIATEDVSNNRGLSAIWSESLATLGPLKELINKYIDRGLLDEIAKRHEKGQRLVIGTTNLDTGQFILWNMGAIASSRDENSLELFRSVLLASSSMPVFFPPVLIKVNVEGKKYDEMHVDGGVMSQVFFYDYIIDVAEIDNALNINKDNKCVEIHVIRNGKIKLDPMQVERNIMDIAKRTIAMMSSATAFNDIARIYYFATQDNIGFNYVSVPTALDKNGDEPFDKKIMKRLYNAGFDMGIAGNSWNKKLPMSRASSK